MKKAGYEIPPMPGVYGLYAKMKLIRQDCCGSLGSPFIQMMDPDRNNEIFALEIAVLVTA